MVHRRPPSPGPAWPSASLPCWHSSRKLPALGSPNVPRAPSPLGLALLCHVPKHPPLTLQIQAPHVQEASAAAAVGTTGGTTPCRTSCGLSRSSAEGARTRPCAPRAASHRWRARDAGGRAARGLRDAVLCCLFTAPAPSSVGPPSANSVLDKTIIQATIICGWLVGAGRPGR